MLQADTVDIEPFTEFIKIMMKNIKKTFIEYYNTYIKTYQNSIFIVLFLGMIAFIAHYLNIKNFGLYEDDYSIIGQNMKLDWPRLLYHIKSYFITFQHGRPLTFIFPAFFTLIGDAADNLQGIYFIGYCIILLNAILVYFILKKDFPYICALAGSLIYLLFPADTTKSFLTHTLTLQVSMSFLLISILLYIYHKKWISYIVIIGCLLTYESAIMPFFAVPLLRYNENTNKSSKKETVIHSCMVLSIIIVYTIVRILFKEARMKIISDEKSLIVYKIFDSIIIGPIISGLSFIVRPFTAIIDGSITNYIIILLMSVCIFIALYIFSNQDVVKEKGIHAAVNIQWFKTLITYESTNTILKALKLFLTGLIMIILAYGLAFTHWPPLDLKGRATSVHLASTMGWSILFAAVIWIIFHLADQYKKKRLFSIFFSLFFALLLGFHLIVQNDFVKSWKIQKNLWRNVIKLCPDVSEETIIFLIKDDIKETQYIYSYSWALPITYEQIYVFPQEWKKPPRLFLMNLNSKELFIKDGPNIKWHVPAAEWDSYWDTLQPGNVIVLRFKKDILTRDKGDIEIAGITFPLKNITKNTIDNLIKGHLYNYLIK